MTCWPKCIPDDFSIDIRRVAREVIEEKDLIPGVNCIIVPEEKGTVAELPPCSLSGGDLIPGKDCRKLPPCPAEGDIDIDIRSPRLIPGESCIPRCKEEDFELDIRSGGVEEYCIPPCPPEGEDYGIDLRSGNEIPLERGIDCFLTITQRQDFEEPQTTTTTTATTTTPSIEYEYDYVEYEYPDYEELPKSEAWKETAEPDQIALVEKYTGKIFPFIL